MVSIKKISKGELPKLISMSFSGDNELIEKYRPVEMTMDETIVEITDKINETSKEQKLTYYKVIYKKQAIGYFVTLERFLYSFAINIKFRKKEILINWWRQVKSVLGENFRCMLYENNERAIHFLEKNGMRFWEQDGNIITLISSSIIKT